ncbi:uncharacterized protein K460DRAFT_357872 [Cucurbitaria berberidis CBS 394.84]|uniref:Uncharacterized protein n=1 Tax=Cucurbitaria berberidis CBS 394.84 TaxID=1168544 RepID=A0A9P4L7M1_9PLEO|nr:uncharacterized protein K460DRAFT_357872 [Cucurbitaria berberidis CBS 394.84]KAF1844253.1 hypothetical protein K460DRAFT_357872 [Cucurbitaria berberidis CBS 394.84]
MTQSDRFRDAQSASSKHFSNPNSKPSLPPMTKHQQNSQNAARLINREHKYHLECEGNQRKICIINDTIGEFRRFSGTVVAGDFKEAKSCTDTDHLWDIRVACNQGRAAVYWTDGNRHADAKLGAGIAWQVGWQYKSEMYALQGTGESADSELFAIAAACCEGSREK